MFFRREVQVKLAKPSKATDAVSTPNPALTAENAENISNSVVKMVKSVGITVGGLMVLNAACAIAVNAAPKN